MEQKFEAAPRAEVRLEGRRAIRGEVVRDWGSQLRWAVKKDGKVVATVPALRTDTAYEHPDASPGTYEVVLQTWKYVDYRKGADGEFTNSKFIDISKPVSYQV